MPEEACPPFSYASNLPPLAGSYKVACGIPGPDASNRDHREHGRTRRDSCEHGGLENNRRIAADIGRIERRRQPSNAPFRNVNASTHGRLWWFLCVLSVLAGPIRAADEVPADDLSSPAAVRQTAALGQPAAIEQRLADTARYLSSDELEGRGPGTRGIELAAQYIAREFRQLGLRTDACQGTPFQRFQLTTDADLGANNRLAVIGPAPSQAGASSKSPASSSQPPRTEWTLGRDFTPLFASDSLEFDFPLAFVGYGITDKAVNYDDYAGVDVAGKAVIVLRNVPKQIKGRTGIKSSRGLLRRKIANAYAHGAAAVIFCADLAGVAGQKANEDSLLHPAAAGLRSHRDLAVFHCRRAAIEPVIRAALGTDLAALESLLARGLAPRSQALGRWRIAGQTDIQRVQSPTSNVIAVLPGTGQLAEETVVVGAHYDHFGLGKIGPSGERTAAIYHGADDNASGVAVLLELARRLAQRPNQPAPSPPAPSRPTRQVVFIAFSGEESGLLGSSHYVSHPVAPLARTVAMLNLDMVGRLRDNKLYVRGSFTAAGWAEWIEKLNKRHGLTLALRGERFGSSDQLAFYAKRVPILHLFTGRHEDYHEPTDTFEKLNLPGMRRVAGLAEDLLSDLANDRERPQCRAVVLDDQRSPYFGVFGDFTRQEPGYAIGVVAKNGPAERAGLRDGDLVVQVGESRIANGDDFEEALTHYLGGERVRVVAQRAGQSRSFQVLLGVTQRDGKPAPAQRRTRGSSGRSLSGK